MSYCLHFSVTLSRTNILENNAYIMALPLYHFIFYSTLISGTSIDQPSGKCLRQNGDQLNTHIHQSHRRHTHQFQNTLPAINQQKNLSVAKCKFYDPSFPSNALSHYSIKLPAFVTNITSSGNVVVQAMF